MPLCRMYSTLLYLHSYNRWLLLLAGFVVLFLTTRGLVQQSPSSLRERIAGLVFLISMDVQFLVGVLLYAFFNAEVKVAFSDFGAAMKQTSLRFYAVEHFSLGLIAMILLHVGNVLARRTSDDTRRRKLKLIFFSLTLLVVLLAIPWPAREQIARPLFR